jgi:O-antigen/teichoic acid export membrane protein
MLIGLYTSRIVLATLGAVDYGIYNVVGGFVTMFAVISGAMTTATQRFISFEIGKGDDGDVKSMFSTAVVIHLFLAVIIFVIAESVGLWFVNTQMNFPSDRYAAVNWVYQFSVLTFMIDVISVPYNAAIVAYEKMSAFAYISIVEVILKLVIVYLLIISPIDKLIIYAALLAIIAIIIRIIYGIYCSRTFPLCHCSWKMDKADKNRMMSFVSWNLIGSLAGILKEQGINVLLNIFFGPAINAARGVAYQVMAQISGFVSNFQLAMNPQIVKTYAANDKENMFKIVFRGSKFSYMLLFTLSLPMLIECPYILDLWLKDVPSYTSIFLRLVIIIALIDSLSGTLIASMHASGKVREYQIIVGGISLLTLPLAYVLLKLGFVPYFAIIANLIIAMFCLCARLKMLKYTIGLPIRSYLKNVLLRVFFVSLLSPFVPILCYIYLPVNIWTVLFVIFISLTFTAIVSFNVGLEKHERYIIVDKIKRTNRSK